MCYSSGDRKINCGRSFLPIKLWDKFEVKGSKVWSKVLGWLKAYYCIRELRKGENMLEILDSLTELKNSAKEPLLLSSSWHDIAIRLAGTKFIINELTSLDVVQSQVGHSYT
jgi:hypothetical protein